VNNAMINKSQQWGKQEANNFSKKINKNRPFRRLRVMLREEIKTNPK